MAPKPIFLSTVRVTPPADTTNSAAASSTSAASPSHGCQNDGCTNRGTHHCAGCKAAHYCSVACQKADWSGHKQSCNKKSKGKPAAPTVQEGGVTNAVRILPGSFTDRATLLPLLEPFRLESWPETNEVKEKAEIKSRFGWSSVGEVEKFYDHAGSIEWYYFMYSEGKRKGATKNCVASLVTDKAVFGDVVVIKSGPADYPTPEQVVLEELVQTILFYVGGTNNPRAVFQEREMLRATKKWGIGPVPTLDLDTLKLHNLP